MISNKAHSTAHTSTLMLLLVALIVRIIGLAELSIGLFFLTLIGYFGFEFVASLVGPRDPSVEGRQTTREIRELRGFQQRMRRMRRIDRVIYALFMVAIVIYIIVLIASRS